jgi:hypothetical protein
VLPSFYCEDMVNVMNRERRREALAKFVGIVKADIERERKGRAGVENLAKALQVQAIVIVCARNMAKMLNDKKY